MLYCELVGKISCNGKPIAFGSSVSIPWHGFPLKAKSIPTMPWKGKVRYLWGVRPRGYFWQCETGDLGSKILVGVTRGFQSGTWNGYLFYRRLPNRTFCICGVGEGCSELKVGIQGRELELEI